MFNLHSINIALHVGAGCIALVLGFAILLSKKGTSSHKRLGRLFSYASFGVCGFAALGLAVFRFMPLFAALLVLVLYLVVSGWRVAIRQADGPSQVDRVLTFVTSAIGAAMAVWLWGQTGVSTASAYGSLWALALVLVYDICSWCFPKRWHALLWRYEHLYKMVSALFGMVSAFVGSVLLVNFTWSPLVVTATGQVLILWLLIRLHTSPGHYPASSARPLK